MIAQLNTHKNRTFLACFLLWFGLWLVYCFGSLDWYVFISSLLLAVSMMAERK